MQTTSTEFQQNVGFYLREAEKGKIITIKKLKPVKSSFKLTLEKSEQDYDKKQSRNEKILNLIKELNIQNPAESGLDFQKRVRS